MIHDPVVGWQAIALHLTRARVVLARIAPGQRPPRQLAVDQDAARKAVTRYPEIVRLEHSGRAVIASAAALVELARVRWAARRRTKLDAIAEEHRQDAAARGREGRLP